METKSKGCCSRRHPGFGSSVPPGSPAEQPEATDGDGPPVFVDKGDASDAVDAVLVEVHDLEEMERALESGARIIGINNRNLRTFEVDLATTERLSEEVGPDHILVSESGIQSGTDTKRVRAWGADAILVGEALMRAGDRIAKMAELKGGGIIE